MQHGNMDVKYATDIAYVYEFAC